MFHSWGAWDTRVYRSFNILCLINRVHLCVVFSSLLKAFTDGQASSIVYLISKYNSFPCYQGPNFLCREGFKMDRHRSSGVCDT
jgi:hypothetical protein